MSAEPGEPGESANRAERVREIFEALADASPENITGGLARAAGEWSGDSTPNDDLTFLVLRAKENA